MDLSIANLLATYELPAIFFGAFFFGELVILTAAFLAGQDTWSISNVFWLALAGTIASDSLWFMLGQTFLRSTKRWGKYYDKYHLYLDKLEEITGQKIFLSLLFIKFLYGTRIMAILYLSMRRMRFLTFLLFNTIGTIIWLVAIILVGWLAGKGVANIDEIYQRFEFVLMTLVLLLVCYKMLTIWLGKKVVKK